MFRYTQSNSETAEMNPIEDYSKTVENHIELNIDQQYIEEKACERGKPNKEENFKCENCMRYFCKNCPNRPIENQCIV